ncbi:unnamed protein product [Didymodactylos carnosus]|uniref:WWE domain-containing protein n=1 Tax=Didymodactylos carnosus TaxID=1234261 RepID=A0A8S2K711_9BILA|nr:unnamed protein product [Didymodactylos carnosus]CAF3837438.1 unnamed protein product [Didymodactylos carnosus]
MATAAPLRNFQWYWNSSTTANDDHWTAYAGIENGIIEEAFQTGKSEVEISSNYVLDYCASNEPMLDVTLIYSLQGLNERIDGLIKKEHAESDNIPQTSPSATTTLDPKLEKRLAARRQCIEEHTPPLQIPPSRAPEREQSELEKKLAERKLQVEGAPCVDVFSGKMSTSQKCQPEKTRFAVCKSARIQLV